MTELGSPEITVRALLLLVRQRARFIAVVMLLFAVLAGAWQLLTAKSYKAAVLVSVVSAGGGGGGLASIVSQLGPLASLAGAVGLGGAQRPESLAILQSRFLTEKYIGENGLIYLLYAKRWDSQSKQWKESIFRKQPTLWSASEDFAEIRRVVQDGKTGLITLTIKWRDPEVAAKWANDLVALTNQYMREREIEEARRNVAYLTDQAFKTDLVEVRVALATLIQNEVKREMLANGTEDFALKVLDPAVPPEEPSSPGLAVSVFFGMLGGLFAAIFYIFAQVSLRVPPNERS